MAAKKRRKKPRYKVTHEYVYWPVVATDGTVVALCPSMYMAQRIADALGLEGDDT